MSPTAPETASAQQADPFDLPADRRRFFFDTRLNATMVWVFQGDFYTSANPNEIVTTVLGSCIAVCVRDPDIRFGGMNHFLLPEPGKGKDIGASRELRYGSYSIERLINAIMAHGGRRDRLEFKIFGGASLKIGSSAEVGGRNADFVENYLDREGFKIAARDLRGTLPRRLRYYPTTGKVMVSQALDSSSARIFEQEAGLMARPVAAMQSSRSEIFAPKPRRPRPEP